MLLSGLLSIAYKEVTVRDPRGSTRGIMLANASTCTVAGLLCLINGCRKLRRAQLAAKDLNSSELVRLLGACHSRCEIHLLGGAANLAGNTTYIDVRSGCVCSESTYGGARPVC
jgi:hypothetical protein